MRRHLFSSYSGLDRSVYVLFAARIVNRVGDFVQLFLVLYLTKNMGFTESAAGRFLMLAGIMNGAGVILGGHMADAYDRKHVLIFCQGAFAAFYIACGFYTDSMIAPYLIFASSIFRGATWPVTNAMVIDLTEGEDRTKAFSLLYLGTNIGISIGPIIAGVLFNSYLNWLFWGDALTTIIAAAAVLLLVPDTKPTQEQIAAFSEGRNDGEKAEDGSTLKAFFQRPLLVSFLSVVLLSGFVYAQHNFTIPLQLEGLFSGDGARYFGYIMTFNALIVILFTPITLKVSDHLRPVTSLIFASILYAVGFGMHMSLRVLPMFFVAAFLWTIGEILMVTNSNVFVAKHTPITHRGRFNSIISIFHGAGFAICPWITGILIERISLQVLWLIVFFVGIASAVGFFLIRAAVIIEESRESIT